MKFIDMFGGIGGFRYGIEQAKADWQCVAYYDIDKYATAAYNYNYKESWEPSKRARAKKAIENMWQAKL